MKSNARIYKITKIKGCKHGAKVHIKGRRPAAECQAEAEKAQADPVPFLLRRVGNVPVKWEGGDMSVACKEKGEGPWGLTGKGRAELFQDAEKRMEQLVAKATEEAKKELKKREKNEEMEVLTTGYPHAIHPPDPMIARKRAESSPYNPGHDVLSENRIPAKDQPLGPHRRIWCPVRPIMAEGPGQKHGEAANRRTCRR